VNIECWARLAERVGQYLTKGNSCLIEGRLKLDQWEDKDGNRRSELKVIADNVQFLDGRGSGGGGGNRSSDQDRPADYDNESRSAGSNAPAPSQPIDYSDEPPF
jgi:single-strand DNA-binding protein